MDVEKIRELAQIAREYQLETLEVTEQGSIVIRRAVTAQPTVVPTAAEAESPAFERREDSIDFNYVEEIKSPMVGVFYEAASPDSAPFVEVGSKVKKGYVLCIIEAMKLMNEITAKKDGEIVDICVQNGEVVEFGQTIFKIC